MKFSKATPTVASVEDAFLPIPAIEETEILSPIAIGQFSKETFVGTRPTKATGAFEESDDQSDPPNAVL